MSTLEIARYRAADRERWDEVVRSARPRHFMFERGYMDYHADRFDDASLLVIERGRLAGVLPASRHGDEVVSHGGLTFGGLLSDAGMTTVRVLEALGAIVATLRGEGVRHLIYKPVPHIYHRAPSEEDLYALHACGAQLVRRDVSAAVAPGADAPTSSERRRALARARSAGVTVAEDGHLEPFMAMLAEALHERHRATPGHTAAEMRLLANRFPENIRLFAASADEEMVAGVIVYETPAVAHAQYISASPRGREVGATDAIFTHLLTERYRDRWVDFGISNERDGSLNTGLMRNKEGYGARAVVYDRYALELG